MHAVQTGPPAMDVGRAAVIGGLALLILGFLGAFANFAVIERLVVDDNAAQTAANIADSESSFRLGVLSLLIVAALDVVVAWALYRVLERVSTDLSVLAAWLRVAYAAILAVATAQLVGLLRLLADDADAFSAEALAGVNAFQDLWSVGLTLFGLHLILVGYLMYRATYAPTVLGILLVIAGLGYGIDGFGNVMIADYDVSVAAFTFLGEVVLIFWLLLRGRRLATT